MACVIYVFMEEEIKNSLQCYNCDLMPRVKYLEGKYKYDAVKLKIQRGRKYN